MSIPPTPPASTLSGLACLYRPAQGGALLEGPGTPHGGMRGRGRGQASAEGPAGPWGSRRSSRSLGE